MYLISWEIDRPLNLLLWLILSETLRRKLLIQHLKQIIQSRKGKIHKLATMTNPLSRLLHLQNRGKKGREDKIEQTMKGVVQQIFASQEASDRHFLELEEKRMKFEEYMVEKEDQQKREESFD